MARPEYRKLYKTARWQRLRRAQLSKCPYCQCPNCEGKKVTADTVDHIKPHRGNKNLFWDSNNLQSMAKQCHDSGKRRYERSGYWPGCDESGYPVDPSHCWNQA